MALNRISELEWSKLTAKQSIILRTEVRASSQAKGLERGWKRRARLGRDGFFSLASHAQRSILRKTPTVLQSMVQVAFSFHYAFPEIKKKQMRCVLEEPCWVRRCGKGFAVWLYPQTFSSGKLSFRLTMAAENSAYRRVIWKKKKERKNFLKKIKRSQDISRYPGADLGWILTDFLSEHRRCKFLGGPEAGSPRKVFGFLTP